MNCVEYPPVFGTIVFAIDHAGASGPALDALALTVLGARTIHSIVHIALTPGDLAASLRFGFYFAQILAMFAVVGILLVSL